MPGPGPALRRRLGLTGFKINLLTARFFVQHQLLSSLWAWNHGRRLMQIAGPSRPVERAGVVLVAAYYGYDGLFDAFLEHHRQLGVKEFVFLDLSEKADLAGRLGETGGAVWRPKGPWSPSQVKHDLNFLRGRYATGRWCLSLETTDFFVFYRSETRTVRDFLDFLESENRKQVYALVVEMYGEGPADALDVNDDQATRKLQYFDPLGYTTTPSSGLFRNVIVQGGLQRRSLYARQPNRSPALNRIPLAKWEPLCAYVSDTRLLAPSRMNVPHSPWHSSPTACLIRFGLLRDEAHLGTAANVETHSVIDEDGLGRGSSFAGALKLRGLSLKQQFSKEYGSTQDLVDAGLLNPGQWF